MGQRVSHRRGIRRPRARRVEDADAQVEQRLHGQRRNAPGDAEELAFRGRESGGVREVRIHAVEKARRVPRYASADREELSAQSDASASEPSLAAKMRNDAGEVPRMK